MRKSHAAKARVVLGIADNHDAGAVLVIDGRVVAAVSEERLDRIKNSGAFPSRSIDWVMKKGGIGPADIDLVALGTTFTPAAALRALRGVHHRLKSDLSQFSYLLHLYILYQVALRRLHLVGVERTLSLPVLRRALGAMGVRARLVFMDHHRAHAFSAALTSPFERSLAITIDAMGDGLSLSVHRAENGRLETLFEQSGRASINTYYSRITEYLGFRPLRHEGKITGLAALAPPPERLVERCAQEMRFVSPGFSSINYLRPASPRDPFYRFLDGFTRAEIASAAQANLEKQVCAFISWWIARSGIHHLSLAGGVFANVKLNQRINELDEVAGIHVYPHMSDGGLAAGAAMAVGGCARQPIPSPYVGPEIAEKDALDALRDAGVPFRKPGDIAQVVAQYLAEGRVVARAAGALEWGPRALGNRSILYRPDDPSVNDRLNKRLHRTEFMPFAPSTLEADAAQCYLHLDGALDSARFMTLCFECSPAMKASCPGVVHVDGTARPQIVRREDNAPYHQILTRFKALTGKGSIVNTSFNMHEEPIVANAKDALNAWRRADLDALVLGPFFITRGDC